jgi:AAA domain
MNANTAYRRIIDALNANGNTVKENGSSARTKCPAGKSDTLIVRSAVGKDVSDHIAAGKTLDDLVPLSLLDTLGVTSEWLEAQEFPDLEEIVPGLIVEGVTVLAGPPKVGKSFVVGNIAIAIVSGGKALGFIDVRKRPALVLALEGWLPATAKPIPGHQRWHHPTRYHVRHESHTSRMRISRRRIPATVRPPETGDSPRYARKG